MEIDGHNFKKIISALKYSKKRKKYSPLTIIAHTVKGKGVSFMENKLEWHYLPMNDNQFLQAIKEVKKHSYA